MKNKYEIMGESTVIFIERKDGTIVKAVIDTDKLAIVNSYKNTWVAQYYKNQNKYYVTQYAGKDESGKPYTPYRLHRILINCPDDMEVDHVNHNTLDNRCNNLNIVSSKQNHQNNKRKKRNGAGYRGVFERKGKYYATFARDEHKTLGSFLFKKDAIIARINAEIQNWEYGSKVRKYFKSLPGTFTLKDIDQFHMIIDRKERLARLVKTDYLMQQFRVSRQCIEQYRKKGMPCERIGGHYFYEYEDCQAWVEENIFKTKGSKNAFSTGFKKVRVHGSLLERIINLENRVSELERIISKSKNGMKNSA